MGGCITADGTAQRWGMVMPYKGKLHKKDKVRTRGKARQMGSPLKKQEQELSEPGKSKSKKSKRGGWHGLMFLLGFVT